MWAGQGLQKLVCPCGFDEENCIACSDFKLKTQRNVCQDGMKRMNLNDQEKIKISEAFSKVAKSVEERELGMVAKGKNTKYRDLSSDFKNRSLNSSFNRNKQRQRKRSLNADRDPKFLTRDEFGTTLKKGTKIINNHQTLVIQKVGV